VRAAWDSLAKAADGKSVRVRNLFLTHVPATINQGWGIVQFAC
jgi:hypothetical protein